jgi:hypothetical protein
MKRNISIVGGVGVCELLIRNDCVLPIAALLQKEGKFSPNTKQNEQLLIQVTAFLWTLCENVERCLETIAELQLLPHIIRLLTPHTFPEEVMTYTAHLLNVLTEDYEPIRRQFSEEFVLLVKATMANQKNSLLLRILCASILFNLTPAGDYYAFLKTTAVTFFQTLNVNTHVVLLEKLSPLLEHFVLKSPPFEQIRKPLRREINAQQSNIDSQIISLETLTNLCFDEEKDTERERTEDDIQMESEASNISGTRETIRMLIDSGLCKKVIFMSPTRNKFTAPCS